MADALKILVIDDSADDRLLYRRSLGKSADTVYTITEADDGEKGLNLVESVTPDCILLDYSLPGRNGVEVLKRIRAKSPFVPVVILTGQGNESVAVSAMKEGAQDYIAKSTITPEALERVVRVAVAHGDMQRRIYEQRNSLEIFSYALAHDLREPTNTVRSFSDLILAREPLSERGQTYFAHIQKAAIRMQQLIDMVYLYTRLDAPEQMEKGTIAMEEVFAEVSENLAQLIAQENALVTHDPLPLIAGNRTQAQQLLQNLISNAINHGGGNVHVGARQQDDGQWLMVVRDNGPGVEKEHLEKIFAPFKRMSNTKERGLGLGLAISRKIVEFHGGKIWCESSPGQGATFFFTLPAAVTKESTDESPFPTMAAETVASNRLARLLLVDDNEADVALNRIMLIERSKLQCDVTVANDGKEALVQLREAVAQGNPFDLVLLDINMPVMSGFEMLAHVHMDETLSKTTVVMCTTSSYDIDKRMATSLGASGYLTKPPQFPLFKAIVEENSPLKFCQDGDQYALRRAA